MNFEKPTSSEGGKNKESRFKDKVNLLGGNSEDVEFEVKHDEKDGKYRIEFSNISDPSKKVLKLNSDEKLAKEIFYSLVNNVVKLSLDNNAAREYAENHFLRSQITEEEVDEQLRSTFRAFGKKE